MKADVLLGLQWGDEGKGKIVDVLTPEYNVIARFQGGPNAGHTLEFNNIKHVLHTIPSGIFHSNSKNIIGNGVVIDPTIFRKEIESLKKHSINPADNLYISSKAHLILPTHKLLDAAYEASKGKNKIGSTLKGIGPTYTDKIARNGLRTGDIFSNNFIEKYNILKEKHLDILKYLKFEFSLNEIENEWLDSIEYLKQFNHIDVDYSINNDLKNNKKILAEGAQGTMLDIDFGTYPFVTSSNTITAGACTGLGLAPNKIGEVIGIFKAYCTRVGSGPFPTELEDEIGEKLRKFGNEFGSTTGRARRCGWLDLVALKYSVMINGVSQLIMTKADVLNTFDDIFICTEYNVNGQLTQNISLDLYDAKPIYKKFKGWNCDINKITSSDNFPKELKDYIGFIENYLDVPITIVSTGPNRKETIFVKK